MQLLTQPSHHNISIVGVERVCEVKPRFAYAAKRGNYRLVVVSRIRRLYFAVVARG